MLASYFCWHVGSAVAGRHVAWWPVGCAQCACCSSSMKPAMYNVQPILFAAMSDVQAQFDAPFEASKKLRSPLRNTALQHAADVRALYRSAYGRVGE